MAKLAELLINIKASTGDAEKALRQMRKEYATTTDEVKREALAVQIAEREKQIAVQKATAARLKETQKQIKDLKESAEKAKEYALKITAPFVAVSLAAVKTANDAEKSTRRMGIALRQSGQFSEQNLKTLIDLSNRLQKETGVDDDDIRNLEKYFLQMGFGVDKMEELTQGAIGLSVAYDVDLQTAAKAVTLAQNGNFSGMEKIIPAMKALTSDTDKQAYANKALADSYGLAKEGQTQLNAELINLQIKLKEMGETLGVKVIPVLISMAEGLGKVIDEFNGLDDGTQTAIISLAAVAAALPPILATIANLRIVIAGLSTTWVASFATMENVMRASKIYLAWEGFNMGCQMATMLIDGLKEKFKSVEEKSEDTITIMSDGMESITAHVKIADLSFQDFKKSVSEGAKVMTQEGVAATEKYTEALQSYEETLAKIAKENELEDATSDEQKLQVLANQIALMDDLIAKKKELANAGQSDENAESIKELTKLTQDRQNLLRQGKSIYADVQRKEEEARKKKQDEEDKLAETMAEAFDDADKAAQKEEERVKKEAARKQEDIKNARSEFELESKISVLKNRGEDVASKSAEIEKDIADYQKKYGYSLSESLEIWKQLHKEKESSVDYSTDDKATAQKTLDDIKEGKLGGSKKMKEEAQAIVAGKSVEGGFKSARFKKVKGKASDDVTAQAFNAVYGKSKKHAGASFKTPSFGNNATATGTTNQAGGKDDPATNQPKTEKGDAMTAKIDELVKEFKAFSGKFEQAFAK